MASAWEELLYWNNFEEQHVLQTQPLFNEANIYENMYLIENCQNIKMHDQKTALFNLAKICFYWLAVDVSGGHFNIWEMQSMSFGTTSFHLYTLPLQSNSKVPLFGDHTPFRGWLISILFRYIIFEVIWSKSSS